MSPVSAPVLSAAGYEAGIQVVPEVRAWHVGGRVVCR